MRRARRVDANQKAIVQALRDCGCTVEVLSDVGRGVPDLLVGNRCRNILLECKVAGAELTAAESEWHRAWRGRVAVVRSVDEAIAAVNRV
jgi:hypothetical protein